MNSGDVRTLVAATPMLVAATVLVIGACGAVDRPDATLGRVTETDTPPPTPLFADDKVLRA